MSVYSSSQKQIIYNELQEVFASDQFTNAPTVRAFLDYVVNESLAGNARNIKAYTIAIDGLGRSESFDPATDTSVRTTAGRVRKALQTYYNACDREPQVKISLPRGGYTPSFDFAAPTTLLPTPDATPLRPQDHFKALRFRLPMLAMVLVLIVIGLTALFPEEPEAESVPNAVVVGVQPVRYGAQKFEILAREIDFRLAPALARIGIAEIIPSNKTTAAERKPLTTDNSSIPFELSTTIIDGNNPTLLWKLIDAATGRIVWTGRDPLSDDSPGSLDLAVDRLAFHILGMGGGVPLALERYHGNLFARPTCISRAQIAEILEDDATFNEMRDCLNHIVEQSPNDAAAWAVLSMMYTNRSRFYSAGTREERAALVDVAEHAAEMAALISPTSYLTKVALMRLALRQGRIRDFDKLQQEIRDQYPGDIFLQIRIATRLARLGRSTEALKIFDTAEREFGINLLNWSPGIAVAHYAAGNFEAARREIFRSPSNLRFVRVLKIAVLGKLGLKDQATPIIEQLVETDPEFKKTFYSWLENLGWAKPLVLEIADGLEKAGLVVVCEETTRLVPEAASPEKQRM